MSELSFLINGIQYSGFEEVQIFKSMNQICDAFAVSASDFFQGGVEINEIHMGDTVVIQLDGQIIFTGYVERMPVKYGQDFDRMDIYGRGRTCDLIDCSYDFVPNEWKLQTVSAIITNLCLPFGILVEIDPLVTAQANMIVETFKATEGAYIYEDILKLCREYQMIPITTELGNLKLTTATSTIFATDAIIVGTNALAGYLDQSNENRYSTYKVKGQGYGTNTKILTDYIVPFGLFADTIITRPRPLVIFAEDNTNLAQCQNRAKWEARLRAGLSRRIEYEVQGWTQAPLGIPWQINQLVFVDDYITGTLGTKLISDVAFIYDEDAEGEIAKITVVEPDTYTLSDTPILTSTGYDLV